MASQLTVLTLVLQSLSRLLQIPDRPHLRPISDQQDCGLRQTLC